MPEKTKLLIFDLDGTLVNSLEDLGESANAALAQEGFPIHPIPAYRFFVGGGIPRLIQRIVPPGTPKPQLERVHRAFSRTYEGRCLEKTRPYPGILPLLEELSRRGIAAGVFSNKDHAFTCRIVSALFPGNPFAFVQGMEPGMPKKPDPAGVLPHLARLSARPGECVYLGDSGVDMRTAAQGGFLPVGVLWGFRDREELLENGAKHLIHTPQEVLPLL